MDLWCLGVLAYELLVGDPPFTTGSSKKTRKRIEKCEYDMPAFVSPYAQKFIKDLLVAEQSKRMPLKKAKSHLWIILYEITKD